MSEVRSPTLRRRELGALLRSRRLELGLTVDQVAERLLCSPSKVSRMETGQRGATQRDVRDLCNLYEITEEDERGRLMTLAREGKEQGWWQSFGLPYADFVGLEQEASSMKIYHSAVVTGLLQTGEYARAVHEASLTPKLAHEVIDQRVEERFTRQRLLNRTDPPRIHIVMDEAVLHRTVGGATVMHAQLGRILEVARRPNIAIQILPFKVGAHPALESDFIILEFGVQHPRIVYVEGLVGQFYVRRTNEVHKYLQVFERLCAIGSSPKDSADLITKIRETYNG